MVAAEGDDLQLALLRERAELAQDAGRIGIYDCDLVKDRWEWDSRVRAMWGLGEDEVVTYKTFLDGVHEDDRADVAARIEAAIAPGSDGDYVARYRLVPNDSGVRWVEATGRVTFKRKRAARMVGTVRDITEEKIARDEKEAAEQFTQDLILTAPTILYLFDLVERRHTFLGPQIAKLTGYDVGHMQQFKSELIASAAHPDDVERITAHYRAIRTGEAEPPFRLEFRMRGSDGRWSWLASTEVVHTRDPDGRPRCILGAALDVTARREAEQARELLGREIAHRAQNKLAMIRSIAAVTLRPSCDGEAWRRFEGRLDALAQAQRLRSNDEHQSAGLAKLIAEALSPFGGADGDRLEVTGPEVELKADAVMNLTLVLHELATNAAKYGALSTPGRPCEGLVAPRTGRHCAGMARKRRPRGQSANAQRFRHPADHPQPRRVRRSRQAGFRAGRRGLSADSASPRHSGILIGKAKARLFPAGPSLFGGLPPRSGSGR